jgi:threonine/homoserine/homoserine lactone efflux protein
MISNILLGSGLAFAAAIQPGPLQAFFLSSVAQRGWRRTLPASFAPLISDGPIALLALFVLARVPATLSALLQAAGGLFLLYLAWSSFRDWQRWSEPEDRAGKPAPRTLLQAATINLLNPGPYLGWSLVLGPAFLTAWEHSPASAVALLVAFYGTMVACNLVLILLLGTTRYLRPGVRRMLVLVSTVVLAALGVYMLAASLVKAGVVVAIGTIVKEYNGVVQEAS